jgi:hypothetical protein
MNFAFSTPAAACAFIPTRSAAQCEFQHCRFGSFSREFRLYIQRWSSVTSSPTILLTIGRHDTKFGVDFNHRR